MVTHRKNSNVGIVYSRIARIRKRDGREVPFDASKIMQAIGKASQAIGQDDQELTRTLSQKVITALEEHFQDSIPDIEEIQDTVEQVLIKAGQAKMAKAYILYRDERRRAREALKIRREPAGGILVEPSSEDSYLGWEKGRIAQALEMEAGLPAEIAAQVAKNVERKVFLSGMRQISTALIRELVDNELFEMGYRVYLKKQSVLGLPKFDLDRLLYPYEESAAAPQLKHLENEITSLTLRQYALQEVFSREVVQAHFRGDIHIYGLASPCKALTLTAPQVFPWPWEVKKLPREDSWLLLPMLEQLSQYVSQTIYLEHTEARLADIPPAVFFAGLANLQPGCTLVLQGAVEEQYAKRTISLLDDYEQIAQAGGLSRLPTIHLRVSPQTFSSPKLYPVLRKALHLALRFHLPIFQLQPHYNNPWVLGAVGLNLARAAYNSQQDQQAFQQNVRQLLGYAIKAHLDKKRFINSLEQGPHRDLVTGSLGRCYCASQADYLVQIVGFAQAMEYFQQEPQDYYALAQDTLANLEQECREASQRHGLPFCPSGEGNVEVARRLATLDSRAGLVPEIAPVYDFGPVLDPARTKTILERIQWEGPLFSYFPGTLNIPPPEDSEQFIKILEFAISRAEITRLKVV